MKKITSLTFFAVLLLSSANLFSQKNINRQITGNSIDRCATIEAMDNIFRNNPNAKIIFEKNQAALEKKYKDRISKLSASNNLLRTQAIVTIPVVVHIVLPNPDDVSDAAVIDQINILNTDYSGLNPDSTNAISFYPVRGHTSIRFCLAQRNPSNTSTTGIERKASSTLSDVVIGDKIKYTNQGGLDAWDPTKYLNIWVCQTTPSGGGDILGYATFPGIGAGLYPLIEHGLVIHYQAFSSINPTGTTLFPDFNKGRTSVHELGHFFNLKHIWGDTGGCAIDDGVSDTPLQDIETSGCPATIVTDVCTPANPGIMYQNFMDYTDDACYSMFTNLQNIRMQTALSDPTRSGLTTSNGCQPPVLIPNNASIAAFITPLQNFATCNNTIPLSVILKNAGSNIITSATITVKSNGTTVQTFNWSGSLASLASVTVPLNAITLAPGTNTIQVCSSLPNGVADADAIDDCKTVNGYKGVGAALPLAEGFEGNTFPPAGWQLINPDGAITWQRNTTGLMHGGIADAFMFHYNYTSDGQIDDLITTSFIVNSADSMWVSFYGAYKGYPNSGTDQLQVAVSTNCGSTYTTVYNALNDTAFAVNPLTTTNSWTTTSQNEWIKKSIDLSPFIAAGNIQVRFRAINRFGNNFFLDDINIDKKSFQNNDAGVVAINKPIFRLCNSSDAPEVIIKNLGKLPLTSVKINYQLDGAGPVVTFNWTGNLLRNQTAVVTFPVASFGAIGSHSIHAFTTLPNNIADQDLSNDGLVKPYTLYSILPLPSSLTEDFTNTIFPPANWEVVNPDADITWERNPTAGKKAAGSAWFNDYVNNSLDRIDDLRIANYSYSGIDSIFMYFNLAHVTFTPPGTQGADYDTLSVLLSKDCGNTYTTIYKKQGTELETVLNPTNSDRNNPFTPTSNQWRRDSINLGSWLSGSESQFQLSFRFNGNFENNFFLDDVNIRTQILPPLLKSRGYLILPNPFRNSFAVWHYQRPGNLRYINVYSSSGQLVWSKQYPNGADKYIQIDLASRAAGIYTVSLGYFAKPNVIVKVMKY